MRIGLKVFFEIEMDEENPELLAVIERQTQRMAEQLEAHWADALKEQQKKHPDLKFYFNSGEE